LEIPVLANVELIRPACCKPEAAGAASVSAKMTRVTMTIGTVKFFNTTKGYGFIEPEDGTKDAFVHISAVKRSGLTTLNEGQKVSYDLQAGRDGKMSATNLKAL